MHSYRIAHVIHKHRMRGVISAMDEEFNSVPMLLTALLFIFLSQEFATDHHDSYPSEPSGPFRKTNINISKINIKY